VKNILVIEDDSLYASTVEMVLLECGNFDVSIAYNLTSGIEKIKNYKFDFVICDLGLPDSYGVNTAVELRKHTNLPIIILSGIDFSSIIAASLSSNAVDYILKSELTIDRIMKTINSIEGCTRDLIKKK